MPVDLESYAEPEVAVAAVVVAAVVSPPVRRTIRRGVVYGLAGLLLAGDKVAAASTAVAGGVQRATRAVKRGATETPAADAAVAGLSAGLERDQATSGWSPAFRRWGPPTA